jgi:hypothetical protein
VRRRQKRPTIEAKETHYRGKRDLDVVLLPVPLTEEEDVVVCLHHVLVPVCRV